jgi:hypothetical protein
VRGRKEGGERGRREREEREGCLSLTIHINTIDMVIYLVRMSEKPVESGSGYSAWGYTL